MKILVGNNFLRKTGGTENYTYTLALELKRKGHNVEYFTFERGEISSLLEKAGIPFMSGERYDLILANHYTVVEKLCPYGYIIQTCHGYIPLLEQPSSLADAFVSISSEVRDHLQSKGYDSTIIMNGIDCNRFRPERPVSPSLTSVLSLCQSDVANDFIRKCCESIGVKFLCSNKHTDNVWSIEKMINQCDLVIGLGRSAYDAMACGRCVLSYDFRDYMGEFLGDGMLTPDNIQESLYCNCSGRGGRKKYDEKSFIEELGKYSPELANWSREFALKNLNIEKVVQQYISIYEHLEYKREFIALKSRMGELMDKHLHELQAAHESNQQQKEEIVNLQHRLDEMGQQMNDLRSVFAVKSKKHLQAIRLLLWLSIMLIVILLLLVLV